MKVLLLNPRISTKLSTPQEKGPFSDIGENLGLGILSANLSKNNIENKIIDLCLDDIPTNMILDIITLEEYSLVGISIPSVLAMQSAMELYSQIKKSFPNIHITAGGHYASIDSEKILLKDAFDSIIIDDGEDTIVELSTNLNNGEKWKTIDGLIYRKSYREIVKNPPRAFKDVMDDIPFPSRSTLPLVLEKGGYASINTSKGCYGRCIFCSSASYLRSTQNYKWRYRSAHNIVEEIENLNSAYSVIDFIIIDDCFIGVHKHCRKRALEFADLLIKKELDLRYLIMCKPEEIDVETISQLRNSGLRAVSMGIESGDQNVLNRLNRATKTEQITHALQIFKENDIEVFIGLIPFDPESSLDEIVNTIEFLYNEGILNISLFRKRMMIMPGSLIESTLIQANRLDNKKRYQITDKRTETLASIIEKASAKFGGLLNNLLYVKKWERVLERDSKIQMKKKTILLIVEYMINKKSYQILKKALSIVNLENPEIIEDEVAFLEKEIEQLYGKVYNILK